MSSSFMPLYVGDYLSDTAHLTAEEHGAYLLLIMAYWQSGRALPNDPKRLALIARLPNERWTDVERTLQQFFNVTPTEWQHERIEAELDRYRDKVEKAKNAGKASARKRKATKTQRPLERPLERPSNYPDPYPEVREVSPPPPLRGAEDEMPDHVKPVKNWNLAFAQPEPGIEIDGGRVRLVNGTRAEWLERFGGDSDALDLALIEVSGEFQPNSRSHTPKQQIERKLAGIVRKRREQDSRYRSAVETNAKSRAQPPSQAMAGNPTVGELLRRKREQEVAAA